PEHFLILGRNLAACPTAATTTTAATAAADRHVRREDDHVVLPLEIAGVDLGPKDGRIWNLEILDPQTRPAGWQRATVSIDQRDPIGRETNAVRRTRRRADEIHAEVGGGLLHDRERRRANEVRSGRVGLAVRGYRRLEPIDLTVRL